MSSQTPPTVSLTAWRTVAVVAVGGVAFGWALLFGLDRLSLPLPVPPLLGAAAMAVVAALVGWQAYLTWRTVHRRQEPMAPTAAVARLALGKTALLAGAALAGCYAGIALHAVSFLDADLPRARAIGAIASSVACLALAVAGRRLERACEVPPPPPEDPPATPGSQTDESDAAG